MQILRIVGLSLLFSTSLMAKVNDSDPKDYPPRPFDMEEMLEHLEDKLWEIEVQLRNIFQILDDNFYSEDAFFAGETRDNT